MSLARQHQPESVDATARALERLSVRAPYFDLRDLIVDDGGTVRALVPLTPPNHPETGLMGAAQVARHLAILGSCAVALQRDDDERHHYIATKAHFLRAAHRGAGRRPGGDVGSGSVGHVVVEASGTQTDRRSARALAKLFGADGQVSHVVDVHYTVMTARAFNRIMPPLRKHAGPGFGPVAEPVDGGDGVGVQVDADGGDDDSVSVDCGPIPAELCAGHFPDHPVAPMALVMGRMARAGGLAMNLRFGFDDLTYSIDEARVVATKLAHVGQRLTVAARYERRIGGGHLLSCAARADGEIVGEMELTLSVSNVPEPLPFPIGALA